MIVPTPRQWVAGEVVTAADLNAQIYAMSTFLLNPPLCIAENSVTQTIPNTGAATVLNLGGEEYDNDNMHTTTAFITVKTAGIYLATGNLVWPNGTAAGVRNLAVIATIGGTAVTLAQIAASTSNGFARNSVSGIIKANVGDTFNLTAAQTDTAGLVIAAQQATLAVAWQGTGA